MSLSTVIFTSSERSPSSTFEFESLLYGQRRLSELFGRNDKAYVYRTSNLRTFRHLPSMVVAASCSWAVRWLKIGHSFMLQQDDDPQHTSELLLELITQVNIKRLGCPSQAPTSALLKICQPCLKARKLINLNKQIFLVKYPSRITPEASRWLSKALGRRETCCRKI